MLLNRHFSRRQIGVLLVYALLSVMICTFNSKLHFKAKRVTSPVTSLLVEPDDNSDDMEFFSIVPKTTGTYPTVN